MAGFVQVLPHHLRTLFHIHFFFRKSEAFYRCLPACVFGGRRRCSGDSGCGRRGCWSCCGRNRADVGGTRVDVGGRGVASAGTNVAVGGDDGTGVAVGGLRFLLHRFQNFVTQLSTSPALQVPCSKADRIPENPKTHNRLREL
jgi:hypothetical protein